MQTEVIKGPILSIMLTGNQIIEYTNCREYEKKLPKIGNLRLINKELDLIMRLPSQITTSNLK